MQFGVSFFPTDDAIDPASLAAAAEERGFGSLFFSEHTHIPASRISPAPGGGELPRMYTRTYDPFVALTAAATATEELLVGTGVCLLVQRDPITTAKEVASLDRLSGGRFLFGVGAGWNREEMQNHGTDPRSRMALLGDRVHALRRIWTDEEPSYHGRYVQFDPIWSFPKPVRQPHPPVLVGGMGPTVEDRLLEFGDEWLALGVTEQNVEKFTRRAAVLQDRAAQAGRAPIPITLFDARPRKEMLDRYAEAGVTRCCFLVPAEPADQVLPLLDQYAELLG